MKTYSTYKKEFATYTGNASTTAINSNVLDNVSWGISMINDAIRYLATVFYFNETTYTTTTVASKQNYTLPSDFEQLNNFTVQIGGLLWQGKESPSRKHFDSLNVIPFYNDFPQYYYIYNNEFLLYPTPASGNNTLTFHYKKRLLDLSMEDVTNTTSIATVSATNGSTTITATGAAFKEWMESSGWIRISESTTDAANGDNKWYQINTVTDSTHLELKNAYTGANVTGANFTIGDVPILPEDYQDLPIYRALRIYYTSRVPDKSRAETFKNLYEEGYQRLNDKYGSKSTSPVLTDTESPVYNPNLFPRNLS